jgi:hypothetical protein
MHRFIAAKGPVYARVDQVESLRPDRSRPKSPLVDFCQVPTADGTMRIARRVLAHNARAGGIAAILAPNADLLGNLVNGDFALELPDSTNRKSR